MSDAYYRTFNGLRTLIYKEWLLPLHNFIKKSGLIMQGANGEQANGQFISTEIKGSQTQMLTWENVCNAREYQPLFIFFLDCLR